MHQVDGELLRRTVRVLVVGCGGNGSAFAGGLPYLHQAMIVAGHPGGLDVTLMDGDVISPSNCVRQPFSAAEIGLHKSVVLISRINLFWGLYWKAHAEYFTPNADAGRFDIVVGCVDTRAARNAIHHAVTGCRSRVAYYLDLGNSSDSGQFVLGQPWNDLNRQTASRLRTAGEVFPELLEAALDPNDGPSCSAIEAIERQAPFVNAALAQHALALLARLFRHGSIDHHGAFVSIAQGRVLPISINPAVWSRMRRRGRKLIAAARLQAVPSRAA
jgi:PRTRC genetic system ThiF family protein